MTRRRRYRRVVPSLAMSSAEISMLFRELLRFTSIVLLIAGIYFFAMGVFDYIRGPVDVGTYRLSLYFKYDGDIADFLALRAVDRFSLTEANLYAVTIGRYDASAAPELGVAESSWSRCSTGLVITVSIDDRHYGPYCHDPSLLSPAFWTGGVPVEFTLNMSPGPHTVRVYVTYRGVSVAYKEFTVSVPTYEEASERGGE